VQSRQPFLDGARALLARGYDPPMPYNMRHANSDVLSFVTTTIGHAAGLSVNADRTRFQKFIPFEGPTNDQRQGWRPTDSAWLEGHATRKGSAVQSLARDRPMRCTRLWVAIKIAAFFLAGWDTDCRSSCPISFRPRSSRAPVWRALVGHSPRDT
jgi:hypothetical protein